MTMSQPTPVTVESQMSYAPNPVEDKGNSGTAQALACGKCASITVCAIASLVIVFALFLVGTICIWVMVNPAATIVGGTCAVIVGATTAIQAGLSGVCASDKCQCCANCFAASGWILYSVAWILVFVAIALGQTATDDGTLARAVGTLSLLMFFIVDVLFVVNTYKGAFSSKSDNNKQQPPKSSVPQVPLQRQDAPVQLATYAQV